MFEKKKHTIYGGYEFTHSDGIDKRSLSSILKANEWELHLLFEEQAGKYNNIKQILICVEIIIQY